MLSDFRHISKNNSIFILLSAYQVLDAYSWRSGALHHQWATVKKCLAGIMYYDTSIRKKIQSRLSHSLCKLPSTCLTFPKNVSKSIYQEAIVDCPQSASISARVCTRSYPFLTRLGYNGSYRLAPATLFESPGPTLFYPLFQIRLP